MYQGVEHRVQYPCAAEEKLLPRRRIGVLRGIWSARINDEQELHESFARLWCIHFGSFIKLTIILVAATTKNKRFNLFKRRNL